MYEYRSLVLAVHDGDTITLDLDLGFHLHNILVEMRLAGVDAPELKATKALPDGLGEIARDALNLWLVNHPGPYVAATVKDHAEKYGRILLASLTAPDGRELIADQTTAGWLKPYSGSGPKPTWP